MREQCQCLPVVLVRELRRPRWHGWYPLGMWQCAGAVVCPGALALLLVPLLWLCVWGRDCPCPLAGCVMPLLSRCAWAGALGCAMFGLLGLGCGAVDHAAHHAGNGCKGR